MLSKNGYIVETVSSGEEALAAVRVVRPDLILLDLMLPGINGLDICRLLKNHQETASIPIIMVTAKGEEADIITGLEIGADDYVTKPFSPRVLLARIRAELRRQSTSTPAHSRQVKVGPISIDSDRHEARVDGELIDLTRTEFLILHYLAARPGHVYTRYQIIDGIRGDEYEVTDRAVDVQITGLRKKLGSASGYIETIRGVGYRLRDGV